MPQSDWKDMLLRLNELYYEGLSEYQQAFYDARQVVFYTLPGTTVILAESHDSNYAPAMSHVFAAEPLGRRKSDMEQHHPLQGKIGNPQYLTVSIEVFCLPRSTMLLIDVFNFASMVLQPVSVGRIALIHLPVYPKLAGFLLSVMLFFLLTLIEHSFFIRKGDLYG